MTDYVEVYDADGNFIGVRPAGQGEGEAQASPATAPAAATTAAPAAAPAQAGGGIVPPMAMPVNPELLTAGPGAGGGMQDLYDRGILPRRYVEGADGGPTIAGEIARAAVGGVRDGIQEMGNTIQWAAESAGNAVTGGHDLYWTRDDGFEWLTEEEVMSRTDVPEWQTRDLIGDEGLMSLPEVAPNETMAGGMSRSVVQFLTGYAAISRGLGVARAATAGQAARQGLAIGALTDFSTFDPWEDRFSDFLRDNIGLQDPVTAFLAADEDDTELEGRLMNAIEGLGMGLATEAVFHMFRAYRAARGIRATDGEEAAVAHMNDAMEEIAEANPELGQQLELFDETFVLGPERAAGRRVVNSDGVELTMDGLTPRDASAAAEAEAQGLTQGAAQAETEAAASVTNANAEGIETQQTGPVNHEGLTAALQREVALQRGGSQPDPYRQLEGTVFNQNYMDSDVSAREVIEMAAEDIRAFGVRESTTFDAMTAGARRFLETELDIAPGALDANLARMAQDAHHQQAIVIAGKELVQSLAREIEVLAHRVDSPNASEADMTRFLQYQARLVETSANLRTVITGAAQTTAAGRIRTFDSVTGQQLTNAEVLRQMQENIDSFGGPDAIRELARAVRQNTGGTRNVLRLAEEAGNSHGLRRAADAFIEMRVNGMLSGLRTHAINALSNSTQLLLMPTERVLGGLMSGDLRTTREGIRMFAGIYRALGESFRAAKTAIMTGRNILDPEAAILEANGITNHAIAMDGGNPVLSNIVNPLGTAIRMPSRLLIGSDELFKQLSYRSEAYARLVTEAGDMVASGRLDRDRAAQFVADRMERAFDRHGAATSQAGLDYAREATFTRELRRGSAARRVQEFTNAHPLAKIIMPFVRTPTNVFVAGVQRTPIIRRLSRTLREDIASGDPRRVASARGKLATGSLIWGAAALAAAEGKLTGNGPVDPQQRALLRETGWRPYSFVTENADGTRTYTEFSRAAPWSIFLGLVADITEMSGQAGEREMDEIAQAAIISLTNNVSSQLFLQGIFDLVDAISQPERRLTSYLASMASSSVPYSAMLRDIRRVNDPVMREVRSMVDGVRNTVPGLSETLPARRSWITGQPILYPTGWGDRTVNPVGAAFLSMTVPFGRSDWEADTVLDELAGLGYNFTPPRRSVEGIELSGAQYERLLELHGTVRIGRRTMYQELERVMGTSRYDIDRTTYPDTDEPGDNMRIAMVQQIITAYRGAARDALIREDAELRQAIIDARRSSAEARRSAFTGVAGVANQTAPAGPSLFDALSDLNQ